MTNDQTSHWQTQPIIKKDDGSYDVSFLLGGATYLCNVLPQSLDPDGIFDWGEVDAFWHALADDDPRKLIFEPPPYWQSQPITKKNDGSYDVSSLLGDLAYPYNVLPRDLDPGGAFDWDEVDAFWQGMADDDPRKLVFETPPPPEPTMEELQNMFTGAIQEHLDAFAQTRNYDGILSVTTYATSSVPKFRAEGQYAVEARDATWAKGYEILAEVMSGQRPMPSLEEVLDELPPLAWPE